MSEKSFIGVTVHFLEGISLKSYCLAVPELKERHTTEYIGQVLVQILSDWEISHDKLVTVVTDKANNVVSAVNKRLAKANTPHALPTQSIWLLLILWGKKI